MKDLQGKPNYYSVLTAEVRYDNRLTDSEKLLYSELTALSNSTGECWATNDYLARLYDVSSSTISRRISKLKKLGHIDVKITYKNNTKEIDRRIVKIATPIRSIDYRGIGKVALTPMRRISKENNTSVINITSNNTIGEWFVEFYENLPTITLGEKTYRILRHDAIKENNGEIGRKATYYILLNEFEDQIYYQTPYGKTLENEAEIRKMGFGAAVDDYTFDKYDTPQIFQKKLKKRAIDFVEKPAGWFTILGVAGCGKSHISTAISMELMRKKRV